MMNVEMAASPKLILASTSPQRKALLETVGASFEIMSPTLAEERLDDGLSIDDALAKLALEKAKSVTPEAPVLIIGCDTVVTVDDRILGKPVDREEAKAMLSLLRGRSHVVRSGVAVYDSQSGRACTAVAATEVRMRDFDDAALEAYLASGESCGRAGAYAIQSKGYLLTEGINGSWSNVVGLPLEKLAMLLRTFRKDLLVDGREKESNG